MSIAESRIPVANSTRLLALGIVGAFFLMSFGAEWISSHGLRRVCEVSCFVLALVGIGLFGRTEVFAPTPWRELWKVWCVVLAVTFGAIVLAAVVGLYFGAWQVGPNFKLLDKPARHWLLVKLPTVLVQQIALQLFIVPSLSFGLRRSSLVALISASIFAGLHLPNPLLVGLTWIAGFCWIRLYQRYRQLTPMVVSHFCLAVAAAGFGGEYVLNMRVGVKCLSLMPQTIRTEHDQIRILPHAVSGCVESQMQSENEVIVCGFADDTFHAASAASYCLVDSKRERMIRLIPAFVQTVPHVGERHGFEMRVPLEAIGCETSWELYAENANGWFSKLGSSGSIQPLAATPAQQAVQLIPTQIDGRCDELIQLSDGGRVAGWAIDLVSHVAPTQLGVYCNGREWVVPLDEPKRRNDIANSLGSEQAANCGFDVMIPGLRFDEASNCALFAIDDRNVWHPLPLVPQLPGRVPLGLLRNQSGKNY